MAETNEEKHQETYAAAEQAVRAADPDVLAARAGVRLSTADGGSPRLEIPALGQIVTLTWPGLVFGPASPLLESFPWRLIALHYLAGATGTEPGENWVSYRELPDGLFYANTITREVEEPLARLYGLAPAHFLEAGQRLGGEPLAMADAALLLRPLPRVPLLFALWTEDEEFPAKVKVLYERSGADNLPLQDLRILADLLGGGLKRGAPARG